MSDKIIERAARAMAPIYAPAYKTEEQLQLILPHLKALAQAARPCFPSGEAADEIERLRGALKETATYLDELQNNMLRNDVDMLIDTCKAPEIVAEELLALAEPGEKK